jgi:hypothetical protein
MMSKPIFIIRYPENLEPIREQLVEYHKNVQKMLEDYHVFSMIDSGSARVEFECYNAVTSSDIEIQELKESMENNWKKFMKKKK